MRVIVAKPPGGAFKYITRGFINAFQSVGIDARYWSGDAMELMDFEPDLYIGASAFRFAIPKHYRSKIKIAMHVNPYFKGRLPIVHGTDINEPQDAINWVLSQNPDAVYGYGYKDDVKFWDSWINVHKIKFVDMPTAGDAVLYYPDIDESLKFDIAYLGGRWPFKAHKLDTWLLPIIKKFNSVAIKGWGGWQGIKGYMGVLSDNDSGRTFLSSSKVYPCISEPHTSIHGIDIPERYFKVALCGSMPISDNVPGFDRFITSDLAIAKSPSEYFDLVKYYVDNGDKRAIVAQKIRKQVLRNHTYHHRMMNLCKNLGFNNAVAKFEEKINSFV